mgnify:CR=1 FL=1
MNKFLVTLAIILICPVCFGEIIQDDFVNETLKNVAEPITHTKYNYEDLKKIPIKLSVIEKVNSEKDLYEGQIIKYKSIKDVYYNNKIIVKKDQEIPVRIRSILSPGMNGIPASIILADFKIQGISPHQLTYTYEIFGQDRSLFVFPLKWALTPLPPTGSLTNFIMGGHAKLKPKKIITIYYHPNWI